jgi:hypothetical protein
MSGQVKMKKSITLVLSDEELMELQRIMLDDDSEGAMRFLKAYLGKQVRAVIPSVKMGGKTLESRGSIPDGPLHQ